jgi:proline iminopeptidase
MSGYLRSARLPILKFGAANEPPFPTVLASPCMRTRFAFLLVAMALPLCLQAQAGRKINVFAPQEGFVDSHGALIYYMSVGHGAPLLVVHGGPGASHDYFLPYLLPLMRTNRLIFIDERGSGKSSKLEDPHQYTIANMVEDIENVRQALALGKISLLGHSYGGALAQAYALKYQQNLSHLILGSTFASTKELNAALAKMKSEMPAQARERVVALEAAGLYERGEAWEHGRYPEEYAKLAWGVGYFPYLYQNHPDPNYDPLASNTGTAWDVYREMWGSHGEFVVDGNLTEVEYLDRLPKIKVPTLIIVGDHDESDPKMSEQMHAKIAGSKLVILPKSGHMTFVDQPDRFVQTVRDFIAK